MTTQTRKLISWWRTIGNQSDDPFFKFFVFYVCLDAWMTAESEADSDAAKLRWLTQTENELRKHWEGIKGGAQFQSWLNGLEGIGQIKNMKPSSRGSYVYLKDKENFEEVQRFIYQIRCNLFHGGKSPVNRNDQQLVRWASNILEKWISWTLAKT